MERCESCVSVWGDAIPRPGRALRHLEKGCLWKGVAQRLELEQGPSQQRNVRRRDRSDGDVWLCLTRRVISLNGSTGLSRSLRGKCDEISAPGRGRGLVSEAQD